MRKRILGALTFIAAIGGVIYMKNNSKIKDYKIDYESIKQVGEKIFARLIVNNDEKLSIDTVINEGEPLVEEVKHSEELDELLKEE